MKASEYASQKPQIHHRISATPGLIDTINNTINRIQCAEIKDSKLKNKAIEKIKIVDEKVNSKKNELSRMMNEIVDKERDFFERKTM